MKRLKYEDVKLFIESQGYYLLSNEYTGSKCKLLVKCNRGHEPYNVTWSNFYNIGQRCNKCNIENRRNKIGDIKKFIENNGYKLLSKNYKDRNEKLKMLCPKGHVTFISWANFKKDRRCSECYKFKRLSKEEVKSFLNNFGYDLIGDYKSANRKIEILCPEGHIYQATYAHFYDGKRCPHCKKSTGEIRIIEYLKKNNINFNAEYVITNIEGVQYLRFDFYIKDFNLMIEYDGQQHFKPVEKFGGQEAFEKTKYRDSIKNKYCLDNNINLIRIPYWDYKNIEKILNNKLTILEGTSTTK